MCNQTKTTGKTSESTDFWYDPNGNQISSMTVLTGGADSSGIGIVPVGADNTSSYSEYDSWNQLTKTMQDGKTASYTYNGDGLRMSKTVDGKTTKHIWDGTDIVGDVTDGTVTKYIRGLQLISSKNGSNENFYTYNGHGDVVQLTNSTGAITKQYDYDAFGVETNKTDNDTNPFRYCGEYYDSETDSIYLRARYYKSTTGRFVSEDPIFSGINWYNYCRSNPIMFIDPSGLCEKCFESYEDYQNLYEQEDIKYIFDNFPSNTYLQIIEKPTYNYICAYVKIHKPNDDEDICDQYIPGSNITYRQAIVQGIMSSWSGLYSKNGTQKRIRTYIVDLADGTHSKPNQKALDICLYPGDEGKVYKDAWSYAWAWFDGKSSIGKNIEIWVGGLDAAYVMNVAGHEFGHILGLEDVYLRNDPFYSIMNDQNDLNGAGAQQVDYDMLFKNKTWKVRKVATYTKDVLNDVNNKVIYY